MLIILRRRVRSLFYSTSDLRLRAQSAVKSVLFYPLVYIICTLPAATARLKIMAGRKVTTPELTAVGTMLVSNGFLDVFLYTITRSSLLFGAAVPDDDVYALETFTRFRPDHEGHGQRFSTVPVSPTRSTLHYHHGHRQEEKWPATSKTGSTDDLFCQAKHSTVRTSVVGSDADVVSSPNTDGGDSKNRHSHRPESFASFEKRFEFDLDGIPKRPAEAVILERYEEEHPAAQTRSSSSTPTRPNPPAVIGVAK